MKGKSEEKFASSVEKKLDSMTEAYPKQMKDKKTKAKPPVTAKKDKKFLTSHANYSATAPPAAMKLGEVLDLV